MKKPSPAQLRARAKFAAAARSGKFRRRRKGRTARLPKTTVAFRAKRRAMNPKASRPLTGFQIAALRGRGGSVLYLSGIGLSSNREAASNFGSIKTARHVARQVRTAGKKLGLWKVAVVTKHDSPQEIYRFLLGGA